MTCLSRISDCVACKRYGTYNKSYNCYLECANPLFMISAIALGILGVTGIIPSLPLGVTAIAIGTVRAFQNFSLTLRTTGGAATDEMLPKNLAFSLLFDIPLIILGSLAIATTGISSFTLGWVMIGQTIVMVGGGCALGVYLLAEKYKRQAEMRSGSATPQ